MSGYSVVLFRSQHRMPYRIVSYQFVSYHVVYYTITSHHITSCHITSSHLIVSYRVMSRHGISYKVKSCHAMSLLSSYVLIKPNLANCSYTKGLISTYVYITYVTSCHVMSLRVSHYIVTLHGKRGRVRLTEIVLPRIARLGTVCLTSIGGQARKARIDKFELDEGFQP